MNVELMNYTPEPEKTIITATRTCYQSFEKQAESSDRKLLEHIVKNDESPLEFAVFTFIISDISRVTSHQLVRHRIASYAQKSQRYCAEEDFTYVMPPAVEKNPAARAIFQRIMQDTQEAYNQLKTAGVKNEDARFVLPNACSTQIVCSMNARSFRHFLKMRLSPKSQWEIRTLAAKMKELVEKIAPALVEGL